MVSERQTVPNSRTSFLKCQVVSLFVGRILFFSALGSMELAFSELNEPDLSVYQVYNLKNSLGQLTREPFCRLSVVPTKKRNDRSALDHNLALRSSLHHFLCV